MVGYVYGLSPRAMRGRSAVHPPCGLLREVDHPFRCTGLARAGYDHNHQDYDGDSIPEYETTGGSVPMPTPVGLAPKSRPRRDTTVFEAPGSVGLHP
jgi:hypothetical protein